MKEREYIYCPGCGLPFKYPDSNKISEEEIHEQIRIVKETNTMIRRDLDTLTRTVNGGGGFTPINDLEKVLKKYVDEQVDIVKHTNDAIRRDLNYHVEKNDSISEDQHRKVWEMYTNKINNLEKDVKELQDHDIIGRYQKEQAQQKAKQEPWNMIEISGVKMTPYRHGDED